MRKHKTELENPVVADIVDSLVASLGCNHLQKTIGR